MSGGDIWGGKRKGNSGHGTGTMPPYLNTSTWRGERRPDLPREDGERRVSGERVRAVRKRGTSGTQ